MEVNIDYCMSSYLTFRFVADSNISWSREFSSNVPAGSSKNKEVGVKTSDELLQNLEKVIDNETKNKKIGILLSSGMDSLVLGSLLPEGTKSYTVGYSAKNYVDKKL